MLLALATQLLAPLAALHAEAPDPGQYSAEQFEVKATRGTGLIGTEHPWFNDLIHWLKARKFLP